MFSLFRKVRQAVQPEPGSVPPPGFSHRDVERAALRLVRPETLPDVRPSYLRGTISDVEQRRAAIAAKRERFRTYEPAYMRRAIMDWLDYYDRDLAKRESDIVHQTSRRRLDAYTAERDADAARAKALLAQLEKERG